MEADIMLTSFFWHETYIALIDLIEGKGCLYSLPGFFFCFCFIFCSQSTTRGFPFTPNFSPPPAHVFLSNEVIALPSVSPIIRC